MELEFAKLEFHVIFFFKKNSMLDLCWDFWVGTRVYQTRVPKTVQLTN